MTHDPASADPQTEALQYLTEIRIAMNRASRFTAVPGRGMMLMGAIALAGTWIASERRHTDWFLSVWTVVAFVAFTVGLVAMIRKASRFNLPLPHGPGRRFVLAFSPAIIAGIILTWALYYADIPEPYDFDRSLDRFFPGVWLMMYGIAVMSGGAHSIKLLPVMGGLFLSLGALAAFFPTATLGGAESLYLCDVLLAAGFGGLHLVFGYLVHRGYGG